MDVWARMWMGSSSLFHRDILSVSETRVGKLNLGVAMEPRAGWRMCRVPAAVLAALCVRL